MPQNLQSFVLEDLEKRPELAKLVLQAIREEQLRRGSVSTTPLGAKNILGITIFYSDE